MCVRLFAHCERLTMYIWIWIWGNFISCTTMYVHYIYVHCWERLWHGCQKIIFIQNQVWPRRPSVSLHPPLDSTTTPGLRLHLGNIFWKSCLLHKFAQKKTYLHISRAQWACLVPYSGHSEARQATRMIVQIHFSYTLCQTKPNCIDLWDLNVVGLLVLVTLHTVSPCVLLCLVHTFPTGSHVNKRINSIAIYCLSLRLFCYVLQVVPNLQNTHHTYWV